MNTPVPVPVQGPATSSTFSFAANISPIIQQPESSTNDEEDQSSLSSDSVSEDIDNMLLQVEGMFDKSLKDVKINPYCGGE